jgi:hypothetical protein
MIKRINLLLVALTLTMIGTAYATCYLLQVVVCASNGQSVGTISVNCSGTVKTADLYASEDAYVFERYSVTYGGFPTTTKSMYCDTAAEYPNTTTGVAAGSGFDCYYVDPCNGSDATANSQVENISFLSYDLNSATCQ